MLINEKFAYSISNIGKEKNGDAYLIQEILDENILIAMVSDGVSGQPCDYLASDTVCDKFVEFFVNLLNEEMEERIRKSIVAVNTFVNNYEGKCRKMAATLSLVVVNSGNDFCCFVNVGDSRIFSLTNNKIELLTEDDVILMEESLRTASGLRKIKKPQLTKVIGKPSLDFSINRKKIIKGEIMLLATDGFYEARKATFEKTILELNNTSDFETKAKEIATSFEMFRSDDMTFVVFKY